MTAYHGLLQGFIPAVALLAIFSGPLARAEDPILGPFVPGSGHWKTVKDGTFEAPSGQLPVYTGYPLPGVWYLSLSPGGGSGTASYSSDAALFGSGGVRVQPANFNAPGIALTYGAVIPLTAGKHYVLSGFVNWVSPSAGSGAYLDLWGAPGNINIYPRRVAGWQFVYGTFTATAAPVGIRAGIGNDVKSSDVFYVDEMAITPADEFLPPEPAPASHQGPVALWKADGTGDDSVGTNHLVIGGGVNYSPGHVGQAFDFPGKVGAVVTNGAPPLTNIVNSFTTAFWVYPRGNRVSTAESTRGFSGLTGQQFAIFPRHGGFATVGDAGSGISVGTNGITVVEHREAYVPTPLVWNGHLDGWTHVAVVYDHYVPKLYVNGVLVHVGLDSNLRSAVTPGDIFPSMQFGDAIGYGPFDGLLDDVAIYDRALSADEIGGLVFPRLIDIQFGVDASTPKVGPAAVGRDATDFWNLYSRDNPSGGYRNDGSLFPLKWADGAVSKAGLSVQNAAGAWGNGSSDAMFGSYLYPLADHGNITITVTNLADGMYDVLAYGHGGDGQNTVFGLTTAGTDYGDKATTTGTEWRQLWMEGAQYVRFANVSVRKGQPLVLTSKPGDTPYSLINGLQLVLRSSEPLALNPAGGLFTNHVVVEILGASGRDVRYTTDGTDPVATSTAYTDPLDFNVGTILKARLFADGQPASAIYSAEYKRIYAIDDGISAEWRLKYFGADYATDPRVSANADPDNDGATNLQEFSNGTNPLDPLDGFEVDVRPIPSITWHSVANTTYKVLRKDKLSDQNWVEIQTIKAFGNRTTFSDESVSDHPRFYLIQAVKP